MLQFPHVDTLEYDLGREEIRLFSTVGFSCIMRAYIYVCVHVRTNYQMQFQHINHRRSIGRPNWNCIHTLYTTYQDLEEIVGIQNMILVTDMWIIQK